MIHCVCVLFILLVGEYSILTLHEPVDFITAECGLLCGSFTSNGCSLYWEGIHGCHAISNAHTHTHTHTHKYCLLLYNHCFFSQLWNAKQLNVSPTHTY